MAEQLKPGDYIGLYIDEKLIYTGVLKDQGEMQSGRKVYQLLLVKNIFQRNFPNSLRRRHSPRDVGAGAGGDKAPQDQVSKEHRENGRRSCPGTYHRKRTP